MTNRTLDGKPQEPPGLHQLDLSNVQVVPTTRHHEQRTSRMVRSSTLLLFSIQDLLQLYRTPARRKDTHIPGITNLLSLRYLLPSVPFKIHMTWWSVLLCLQDSHALQSPDRCLRFSVTSTQCPSLHRHHSAWADLLPTTSRRCCSAKGEVHSRSPHLRPPTPESAFFVCFSQRLPEWISVSFQDRITKISQGYQDDGHGATLTAQDMAHTPPSRRLHWTSLPGMLFFGGLCRRASCYWMDGRMGDL